MALTQIRGNKQIQDKTVKTLQIDIDANLEINNFKVTELADGTAASDAVNKGQLDAAVASILTASSFVVREIPTGAINGTNPTFTLAFTPIAGKESVYLNGLLQNSGASDDYQISGATITFNAGAIPQTGDKLVVSYIK